MTWYRAKRSLQCGFGCEVAAGEWALFGRRMVFCQACAKSKYCAEPPQREPNTQPEGFDPRMAQITD